MYSFKTDKLTDEVLPELEDKNNHVVDSLRYALEKLRRSPVMSYHVPVIDSRPRWYP
jgi:phage terminase large subunit